MATKRVSATPVSPARRGSGPRSERVPFHVQATPEQKALIARLGDGSLSVGFDRAVALVVAAKAEART